MRAVVLNTSGYTEVVFGRDRHRITYETIAIRPRLERRKLPFNLPDDLEAVKTPAVSGGHVFKIIKKENRNRYV